MVSAAAITALDSLRSRTFLPATLRIRWTSNRARLHRTKHCHLGQLLGNNFELPTGMSSVNVLRSPFRNCKMPAAFTSSHKIAAPPTHTLNKVKYLKKHASKLFHKKHFHPAGVTMEIWGKKPKIKNDKGRLEWQTRLLVISHKRLLILMTKDRTCMLDKNPKGCKSHVENYLGLR
jgi:hypothetical protein